METPTQPKLRIDSGLKLTQTGSEIQAEWGKVNEADGYEVYGAYSGKKHKLLATIDNGQTTKATITKLNGKKINLKKICNIYVVAYKNVDGNRIRLTESLHLNVVGKENKKFTNVKAIKLKKKSYTLQKGRTAKIKAKLVLVDKNKKPLSNKYGKKFRYASSNKKVATVTKGGKIKAKGTGTCTVYVYAINGCKKKINVIVH